MNVGYRRHLVDTKIARGKVNFTIGGRRDTSSLLVKVMMRLHRPTGTDQ